MGSNNAVFFIQNSFRLNVGHLSTSNDVIDKMAIRHSRHCSVKGLASKRLLIHGLVRGTDSPEFAVMEVLKSFEVAFLQSKFHLTCRNVGWFLSLWELLFVPCLAEVRRDVKDTLALGAFQVRARACVPNLE